MLHIFHKWKYTPATYRTPLDERLSIPLTPSKRVCKICGKTQEEDRHCLGLNPPEYYSRWITVQKQKETN